jgi:hypothetical protein
LRVVLELSVSGKPVAKYAWTTGHSIRPNGQILEGNSVVPRVLLPLTRDNSPTYYQTLMEMTLA